MNPDTHSSFLSRHGQIDIWSVSVAQAEFILAAVTLTLILGVSGSIALHKPRFTSTAASIKDSCSGEKVKTFYCCD